MAPFIPGRLGFRGIQQNLFTGYYSFAFSTTYKDVEDFFKQVENDAFAEGWEPVESKDPNKRTFRRPTDGPFSVMREVTLAYSSKDNEVTFTEETKDRDCK